MNIEL